MSAVTPRLTDDLESTTVNGLPATSVARTFRVTALVSSVRTGRWVRPAIVTGSVVLAYHTSLQTLIDGLSLDTPIAHLALVPLIALMLALAARHNDAGPDISDRQLDWIVGFPLVFGALMANLILPARLSAQFWLWRIDLLTMPFFAAGVVTLVYGIRTTWKMRYGLFFLFLAWPYPYNVALTNWLGKFTDLTVAGLAKSLNVVHLARQMGNGSPLFEITHGTSKFTLSVASACSGANGLVGFLLVGIAFALMVEGTRWQKFLWLAIGAILVWLLNIGRLLVVFFAAHRWGEKVAIDGFHPFVGLIAFTLGVAIMVLVMGRFGLRFKAIDNRIKAKAKAALTSRSSTAPRLRYSAMCVAVMTLGVGFMNSSLEKNDLVSTSLGSPRLVAFAESKETPPGWNLQTVQTIEWAKPFFGDSSEWVRYQYLSAGTTSDLQSSAPITTDIIDTPSRSALNAYGVEACYNFHGYKVTGVKSVDMGGGVVGELLTWSSPNGKVTYTTLYWHWPIKTPKGTSYERVTLIIVDQPSNTFKSPDLGTSFVDQIGIKANDAIRSAGNDESVDRLLRTRQFLVAFGREMIQKRKPAATS